MVRLLMMFGFLGWKVVAVTFLRDPGVGSRQTFVEPLEGFRDISLT
jgi:hypothetical protein